jgi:hypothetical protein
MKTKTNVKAGTSDFSFVHKLDKASPFLSL